LKSTKEAAQYYTRLRDNPKKKKRKTKPRKVPLPKVIKREDVKKIEEEGHQKARKSFYKRMGIQYDVNKPAEEEKIKRTWERKVKPKIVEMFDVEALGYYLPLYKAYGENYQAMVRDKALNVRQETVGVLRKRIAIVKTMLTEAAKEGKQGVEERTPEKRSKKKERPIFVRKVRVI